MNAKSVPAQDPSAPNWELPEVSIRRQGVKQDLNLLYNVNGVKGHSPNLCPLHRLGAHAHGIAQRAADHRPVRL